MELLAAVRPVERVVYVVRRSRVKDDLAGGAGATLHGFVDEEDGAGDRDVGGGHGDEHLRREEGGEGGRRWFRLVRRWLMLRRQRLEIDVI